MPCAESLSPLAPLPQATPHGAERGRREAPGSGLLRSLWEELKPGFCQSVGPHLVPPHSNVSSPPPACWVFQRRRVAFLVLSPGSCHCLPTEHLPFCLQPLIQGCVNHAAVNPSLGVPLTQVHSGRGLLPPGAAWAGGAGHTAGLPESVLNRVCRDGRSPSSE